MARKKSNTLGKIVLIIAVLGCSIVCFDMLLTKPVSLQNTTKIIGHFESLEQNRPARGDLNYDLYLANNQRHYKIAADWADCFSYERFTNEVMHGQTIELLIRKDSGFMNNDLSLVVSIKANDKLYLDSDCVNKGIKDQKIIMSFLAPGIMVGIFLLYRYKFSERKS